MIKSGSVSLFRFDLWLVLSIPPNAAPHAGPSVPYDRPYNTKEFLPTSSNYKWIYQAGSWGHCTPMMETIRPAAIWG